MAWPFPQGERGADACVSMTERDTRCLEPWREEERKVAIMLLVVPVAVFLWKVRASVVFRVLLYLTETSQIAILLAPSSESSWLPSHIRLPRDSNQADPSGARKPRAAIGYRDVEDEGESSARREDSLQRAVTGLNHESNLATHVEANRTKSKGLSSEPNVWREGRGDA